MLKKRKHFFLTKSNAQTPHVTEDEVEAAFVSVYNRLIKKGDSVVNKIFVQMLEVLGYYIQLTYVNIIRREE